MEEAPVSQSNLDTSFLDVEGHAPRPPKDTGKEKAKPPQAEQVPAILKAPAKRGRPAGSKTSKPEPEAADIDPERYELVQKIAKILERFPQCRAPTDWQRGSKEALVQVLSDLQAQLAQQHAGAFVKQSYVNAIGVLSRLASQLYPDVKLDGPHVKAQDAIAGHLDMLEDELDELTIVYGVTGAGPVTRLLNKTLKLLADTHEYNVRGPPSMPGAPPPHGADAL